MVKNGARSLTMIRTNTSFSNQKALQSVDHSVDAIKDVIKEKKNQRSSLRGTVPELPEDRRTTTVY